MKTIVYLLFEEFNTSQNGEIGGPVGVYATKAAAEAARLDCAAKARAGGSIVYSDDEDVDWDVDFVISEHAVQD